MTASTPWTSAEDEALTRCCDMSFEAAAEIVSAVAGNRRTPTGVYYRAKVLNLPWGKWSGGSHKLYRPGNDGENTWAGAQEANRLFCEAMVRAGHQPTPVDTAPATKAPRKLPRSGGGEGGVSSSSGWLVGGE